MEESHVPGDIVRALAELTQRRESAPEMNALAQAVRAGGLGAHPDTIQLHPNGWTTLLGHAIDQGAGELADALLDVGADPDIDAVVGFVPDSALTRRQFETRISDRTLVEACLRCPDIVGRLLASGAPPNHKDDERPPLHNAVRRGRADVVRLLLEAGADPLAVDDLGVTAIAVVDGSPMDPECYRLVAEASAPLLAKRKGASVRAVRGKKDYAGLESMLDRALGGDGTFFALFRRGSAADLANAMADVLGGGLEGDAHKRWVAETDRSYYGVLELRDRPCAVALLEHDTRVDDTAGVALARAVSQQGEVVTLLGTEAKVYRDGSVVETHTWSPSGGNPSHAALRREEKELIQECVAWCKARDIFMPPMYFASDGAHVGVEVEGVKKADIRDAWIVWAQAT